MRIERKTDECAGSFNKNNMHENIILFDGVCSLCNASVDFIVRHEKGDRLHFASLQSAIGEEIIAKTAISAVPDSILFYTNGVLLSESTAVLAIARHLKFPYTLAPLFQIVPLFFRDTLYRLIARNRYRWFGKRDTCRVPQPAERKKFLG